LPYIKAVFHHKESFFIMPHPVDLFTPLSLGDLALPNRIVMAPMTRNRGDTNDAAHSLTAQYYAQRASAGLILTEASQISPIGKGYPGTPGIYSAAQIRGWREVTNAVHAKGGRIFLQLWHVGRISHPSLQPAGALPVAPSAIAAAGKAVTYQGLQDFVTPRALNSEEIPAIVADYAAATRNAREAGFDGVEIHAANGYLIDQFLRDSTNHRQDGYGGTLQKRVRFLHEVIDAVTSAWDPKHVGVKLSPAGSFNDMRDSDPNQHFAYIVDSLNNWPLAYLHIAEDKDVPFDYLALRRHYRGVYMVNRGYDKARANAALADGYADLIAFGVPFIGNPDLVARLAQDAPLNKADESRFYGGGAEGYTDYPTLNGLIS
jgi:N-ethylmaleimide reductase